MLGYFCHSHGSWRSWKPGPAPSFSYTPYSGAQPVAAQSRHSSILQETRLKAKMLQSLNVLKKLLDLRREVLSPRDSGGT